MTFHWLQLANERRLPLQQHLSPTLYRLVNSHADAIVAPSESIADGVASCRCPVQSEGWNSRARNPEGLHHR